MGVPAYISKDEVREKLSLAFACSQLGILLQDGCARCPFHDDTSPSFYLWDGDDGIQRWWCQPCGFGGDVFDLIQRTRGVTFAEALELAATYLQLTPPGYQAPKVQLEKPAGPSEWAGDVQLARERAARPDHAGILSARTGLADVNNPALCAQWDAYLRQTWGWGITESGDILMPHWDAAGNLTGCKIRSGRGDRQSLPGSRYESLYGSWLGRRHAAVLLAEGETDGVWAMWTAAQAGANIDVFALPRGAASGVEQTWLAFLAGYKTIYLAFDPDDAGVEATRTWVASLIEGGFTDIRACCLPLGRDLRAAKPDLPRLLAAARRPLKLPDDITSSPGGFERVSRKGDVYSVTTWVIEPVAQLAGGDEPGYDVVVQSRGVISPSVIRLADMANVAVLRRWANRHGLIFTGSDADVQAIAGWVSARGAITPEVFQTDRVGMHAPPANYRFAGPSVVFPTSYVGQTPWRYAPTPRAADVTGRILLPSSGLFSWEWLSQFLLLSSPDVTHPLLAWVVAAARRSEVAEFPILFIGGSSGVGKSTLARLACRLVGSSIELDLGANTPYVLLRTLAASASLPVFIDEWTRLSRGDSRQALQGAIPVLYTGGVAERGQADLSTTTYKLSAPTIVAGEDTFTLDRELERIVALTPSRAAQNHLALARIQQAPLQRFGHLLHSWLARPHPEDFLPPLAVPAATRPEYNRAVLEAGWKTLLLLADEASKYEEVPELPEVPDLSCFDVAADAENENVYELALVEAASLRDQNNIPVVWADSSGAGTWVRFQVLPGLLEARRVDIELPGRSRAMRAYFTERYGELRLGPAETPPGTFQTVRAHLIPNLHLEALTSVDPRSTYTPS